ncbi:hypothetical protein FKP32DRAFT_1588436 [Trametes sanguinea]|nr:hypothetical protein FKP32DRAFT_1588436 [Trametes sanguinea]
MLSSSAPPSSEPSSSQQKLDVKPQSKLPDEKMRVLVQLYHQADSFITKENLSKRIDDAFIYHKHRGWTALSAESPFHALEAQVYVQRSLPKFGESNAATAQRKDENWSDGRSSRERSVAYTLYGLVDHKRPGYDMVKEEKEHVKRKRAEEKKS